MVYTTNIPQPTDDPSTTSQSQFLNNFNDISTVMSVDHVGFNDADQGKHSLIDFVRQTLPQSANANEALLFGALQSGATELFFGRDGNAATQMTGIIPSTGGGTATSYSWDFASGLSIRFGNVIHTGTATTITFDTAFPNSAYVVLFSPQGAAALVTGNNVQSLTTANFTLNSSSSAPAGSRYYYVALGR